MKTALRAMSLVGLLMVIGTAGSVDLDRISFAQAIVQTVIGMVGFATGIIGGFING